MQKRPFWQRPLFMVIVVLVLAAVAVVFFFLNTGPKPAGAIPAGVAKRLTFPVYLPSRLPGSFKIVSDSFSFDEGVLIFKAQDDDGATIAITEQKKPQNFNFDNFYQDQLSGAAEVTGAPFASMTGTTSQGDKQVLSVVTDKTWLIFSSSASLGEKDIELIAKSIRLNQ